MKKVHFLTTATDTNSDQHNGTNGTPQRVTIPRTITIGEQQFSVSETPEIANLVALVRQDAAAVEKAKLYPQIQKLQTEFDTLKNAKVIDPNGNAGGGNEQILTFIEDTIVKHFKGIEDKLAPLLDASQKNEAASLQEYREKLLRENEGQCIAEMVVGESREALDEALEASKKVFGNYKGVFGVKTPEEQLAAARNGEASNPTEQAPAQTTASVESQATPVTQEANSTQPQTVVLPSAPANNAVATTETPNIGGMSMDEFARRREELAGNLASMVK